MPPAGNPSLWSFITGSGLVAQRFFSDARDRLTLAELADGSSLEDDIDSFQDRSVLILAERQLCAALALAQLDGVARRLVLCPPDITPAQLPNIIARAGVDIVLADGPLGDKAGAVAELRLSRCGAKIRPADRPLIRATATEWLLFTSGTTGHPRLVVHTLDSLAGPVADGVAVAKDAIWSTFYDIRRYGGLQILLRACLGGGSMLFSDPSEPVGAFLRRAGDGGVTHISGTPSHWRRALMSPAARAMAPGYVRLSGEIADQAILNNLRQTYPAAKIAHAFASTEAGVAFDVRDGLAGFPAAMIDDAGQAVEMKVQDGSLRIRSSRIAQRYETLDAKALADADGFVDTGDLVERRGDRYYFIGRREGCINVGGQKVHPEEVEAVINTHPAVQFSRVQARPSPITGAIVVANVVIRPASLAAGTSFETVRQEILSTCQQTLAPHKVPAMLREVAALDLTAAGKLLRQGA